MKKAISKKSATTPSSRGTVVMALRKQTPAKTPKSAIYRCGECLHCRKPKWKQRCLNCRKPKGKKRCLSPMSPRDRRAAGRTERRLTLTDKNIPSKESAESNEQKPLELAAAVFAIITGTELPSKQDSNSTPPSPSKEASGFKASPMIPPPPSREAPGIKASPIASRTSLAVASPFVSPSKENLLASPWSPVAPTSPQLLARFLLADSDADEDERAQRGPPRWKTLPRAPQVCWENRSRVYRTL